MKHLSPRLIIYVTNLWVLDTLVCCSEAYTVFLLCVCIEQTGNAYPAICFSHFQHLPEFSGWVILHRKNVRLLQRSTHLDESQPCYMCVGGCILLLRVLLSLFKESLLLALKITSGMSLFPKEVSNKKEWQRILQTPCLWRQPSQTALKTNQEHCEPMRSEKT